MDTKTGLFCTEVILDFCVNRTAPIDYDTHGGVKMGKNQKYDIDFKLQVGCMARRAARVFHKVHIVVFQK